MCLALSFTEKENIQIDFLLGIIIFKILLNQFLGNKHKKYIPAFKKLSCYLHQRFSYNSFCI